MTDTPTKPLSDKLDEILEKYKNYLVKGFEWLPDELYLDPKEANAAILAAVAAEIRAIVPDKERIRLNNDGMFTNEHYVNGHNDAIDTTTRNARERGHHI